MRELLKLDYQTMCAEGKGTGGGEPGAESWAGILQLARIRLRFHLRIKSSTASLDLYFKQSLPQAVTSMCCTGT